MTRQVELTRMAVLGVLAAVIAVLLTAVLFVFVACKQNFFYLFKGNFRHEPS